MSRTFGERYATARLPHRCENCDGVIHPGQRYLRWAWVDRGIAGEAKVHVRCAEMFEELDYDVEEVGWDAYEFRQDCVEACGPGPFPWESPAPPDPPSVQQ